MKTIPFLLEVQGLGSRFFAERARGTPINAEKPQGKKDLGKTRRDLVETRKVNYTSLKRHWV
jgi:hypothetical protein